MVGRGLSVQHGGFFVCGVYRQQNNEIYNSGQKVHRARDKTIDQGLLPIACTCRPILLGPFHTGPHACRMRIEAH